MQTMKDPAVVGEYNALLMLADNKAERFFSTHGFSDDPILTAKYRSEPSLSGLCSSILWMSVLFERDSG